MPDFYPPKNQTTKVTQSQKKVESWTTKICDVLHFKKSREGDLIFLIFLDAPIKKWFYMNPYYLQFFSYKSAVG